MESPSSWSMGGFNPLETFPDMFHDIRGAPDQDPDPAGYPAIFVDPDPDPVQIWPDFTLDPAGSDCQTGFVVK